jgi:hypothetical protein
MSAEAIARVRQFQNITAAMPQGRLDTDHLFHAGTYLRTILIPANATEKGLISGALIKIATVVIIHGDVIVSLGDDEPRRITGYAILSASAGRKQAFLAIEPTYITMLFATEANDVEDAEREFTDEADDLASRRPGAVNRVIVTGE